MFNIFPTKNIILHLLFIKSIFKHKPLIVDVPIINLSILYSISRNPYIPMNLSKLLKHLFHRRILQNMNSNQISTDPHSNMFYSKIVLLTSRDPHPITDSHTNLWLFSRISIHSNRIENVANILSGIPYWFRISTGILCFFSSFLCKVKHTDSRLVTQSSRISGK